MLILVHQRCTLTAIYNLNAHVVLPVALLALIPVESLDEQDERADMCWDTAKPCIVLVGVHLRRGQQFYGRTQGAFVAEECTAGLSVSLDILPPVGVVVVDNLISLAEVLLKVDNVEWAIYDGVLH